MNISLNNIPVTIDPMASKHDGINIVGGDSFIELKLFFLLLYFPWKVLNINLHEYIDVSKAVIIPTAAA